MRYLRFSVKCKHCGHNNRPHNSPKVGIELVLTGQFNTCRKCGAQFDQIVVTKRPLVMEVFKGLANTLSTKTVLSDYDGKVPMAIGY